MYVTASNCNTSEALPNGVIPPTNLSCPTSLCWCDARCSIDNISSRLDVPFANVYDYLNGSNITLRLDMYSCSNAKTRQTPLPIAVVIHGGGWKDSSFKEKSSTVAKGLSLSFASHGFLAVSIEYRCERGTGGDRLWTDAVADARTAVQW